MCLLLLSFQQTPERPLLVGANRDERYARPALPVALRRTDPLVLAGLDEEAGGTWLAVNEAGVVAGLTNQPTGEGRDRTKRTRGELPFMLTGHRSARAAVEAFSETVDPAAYNPCSILVGDRQALFSVELGGSPAVVARELGPGRYALENRPFGVPTAKAIAAGNRLRDVRDDNDETVVAGLTAILSDHDLPPELPDRDPTPARRLTSACIHSDGYGTRSSMIVLVSVAVDRLPRVLAADGPPCTMPFGDVSDCWHGEIGSR